MLTPTMSFSFKLRVLGSGRLPRRDPSLDAGASMRVLKAFGTRHAVSLETCSTSPGHCPPGTAPLAACVLLRWFERWTHCCRWRDIRSTGRRSHAGGGCAGYGAQPPRRARFHPHSCRAFSNRPLRNCQARELEALVVTSQSPTQHLYPAACDGLTKSVSEQF